MYYLHLYQKKISQYKIFVKKLKKLFDNIEETILQKDDKNKIEEKLMSIGMGTVSISIGSGIASLFGMVAVGFGGGLLLFSAGLLASKTINKKVFGRERTHEELLYEEKKLLEHLKELKGTFNSIDRKLNLDKYKSEVAFTKYLQLNEQLNNLKNDLDKNKTSHLGLKYQNRYRSIKQKYVLLLNEFNLIYKNKNENKSKNIGLLSLIKKQKILEEV